MAKEVAEPPDEVLVVASILGDLDAFDLLAARYRAAVVRTAQAIVGPEDAEDVAQDSLLLAFKALPSIYDPLKFAAWLAAITRHRAMRFGKRESVRRRGRVPMDEFLIEQVEALGDARAIESDGDEDVRVALEGLPADYALVLRLRFFDEMPLKRIAAFLVVAISTVKWRVHRGKQLLRGRLEQQTTGGEKWKEIKR
ncbi:MAG TPA: sigma-70 family RNA polymerase sigma factor [Blastocatellia bacterium]|nr:sigma-70 family RNA polymerase sigma factor [Blastocatellia bacterium]